MLPRKMTGEITNIKYEGGKYYFDVWTEAPKVQFKKEKEVVNYEDAMDVDQIKKQQRNNQFWILGTDGELVDDSGFKWQDMLQ